MTTGRRAFPILVAIVWGCGTSGGDGPNVGDGGRGGSGGSSSSSSSSGSGSGSGSGGSNSGSSGSSSSGAGSSGSGDGSSRDGGAGDARVADGGAVVPLVFSPYKDTSINLNWNTNVISTALSGATTALASDLRQAGGQTITLAFATGECGSENWAGVAGGAMASANVPLLTQAAVAYIVSTGGAAGSFTCGSDTGMATFVGRWASPGLVGVDFDIEAGQSRAVIGDLIQRIKSAHVTFPALRYSLTLATLANNSGASTAVSLGANVPDSFNVYGDQTMAAVESTLLVDRATPSTWPNYLTVNLMTMDYGSPAPGVCVVSGGACQMGQSALQAAYNLHDRWGVPFSNIELTPMIGGNDVGSEQFTLGDVDTVAAFVIAKGLAGAHYWSYDRDVDCAAGAASPTCSSIGSGYAGPHGFLKRFLEGGLR